MSSFECLGGKSCSLLALYHECPAVSPLFGNKWIMIWDEKWVYANPPSWKHTHELDHPSRFQPVMGFPVYCPPGTRAQPLVGAIPLSWDFRWK